MFSQSIKNSIKKIIEETIEEFRLNIDDLFLGHYLFIEENKLLQKKIFKFINSNSENQKIANKNIGFYYPNTSWRTGGDPNVLSNTNHGSGIVGMFDDFVLNTSRICISDTTCWEEEFEKEWDNFQTNFFSEEARVEFICQVANFHYNSGGILDELVDDDSVTMEYLHPENSHQKALIFAIRKSLEYGFVREAGIKEEFNIYCPIVAKIISKIPKSKQILQGAQHARMIFEKLTFLLRLLQGGGAHFDFIIPRTIGNFAGNYCLTGFYEANHFFLAAGSTSFENGPYDTWYKRAWKLAENVNFANFHFANSKLRDSYSRHDDHQGYCDEEYEELKILESLVDKLQALESSFGDFGWHNAEYVSKVISANQPQYELERKKILQTLINIRNKFIHGKASELRQAINSNFKNLEELKRSIRSLDYFVRLAILFVLIDPGLPKKLQEYHLAIGRGQRAQRGIIDANAEFPSFNTIYY